MPRRIRMLLVLVLALCTLGLPAMGWAQSSQANCAKPNVLLVLNKSSNMSSNNKWNLLRLALGQLVQQRNANVRFGLMVFDTNPRMLVTIRDNAFQAIVTALLRESPSGQASHVRAMTGARFYLNNVIQQDQVTGRTNRVILFTDGSSSDGDPNAQLAALRNTVVGGTTYDIQTFVVGTSSGSNLLNLARWAATGGTARPYLNSQMGTLSSELQKLEPSPSPEACDGQDNDCDGDVDEGLTRSCTGSCGTGTETCTDGKWGNCSAVPSPETCNAQDDDCNGQVDDNIPSRFCQTACGIGNATCSAGRWICDAKRPAPEVCDGQDNDCDGEVDEGCPCRPNQTRPCGTDTGDCRRGVQTCVNGQWSTTCSGSVEPRAEVCDNADNDCDGATDEGLTRPCANGCGNGTERCNAGQWVNCSAPAPKPETCDGQDNDCDGQIDEGCQCRPGQRRACGTNVGACRAGFQECQGGQWSSTCTNAINPQPELCDNIDNDCDGLTDEGLTRTCGNGCGTGIETCQAGQWGNCSAPPPQPEVCNGRDDDCDGQVDEGCPCRPGQRRACGTNTGACQAGFQECQNGQWGTQCQGQIGPTTEVCDGIDNDCDGATDESLSRTCSNACGSGSETCNNGKWENCSAPQGQNEVCNGRDDDCDGEIDEGCPCRPGTIRRCGSDTGECRSGFQRCVNGQWNTVCEGEIAPKAELCDGRDNDCDGATDESLTRSCSNGCGSGSETCNNGQWVNCSAPPPGPELCNGRDDDCDGTIDEGCRCRDGQTRACGTNTGACQSGRQSCVNGQWEQACNGSIGPKTEVCDGQDNDCDGQTDESLIRPCANACGNGNETCENGAWSKCDAPTPVSEICNGRDDDCDGTIDEGCRCRDGQIRPCGTNAGACRPGAQRCVNGQWEATCNGSVGPSPETCDGQDNDCDGLVDESLTRECKTACGVGTQSCQGGAWSTCSAQASQPEVCDNKDNDCDGTIDEGLTRSCSNACGGGVETCAAGQWVKCTAPQPTTEVCDQKDNDCDGAIDEGCTCQDGEIRRCGSNVGECQAGTQTCVGGKWSETCSGATGPGTEACDGKDNDCDGQVDEGITRPCKTTCGEGSERCNNGNWQGCSAPQPSPEVCDGRDNDCDGSVDENLRRTCSNACGQGSELCQAGQWIGCSAPQPLPETCNGRDDDCDGQVDEGCRCRPGQIRPCGSNIGECQAGGQRCIPSPNGLGQWEDVCRGATEPQPETCDGRDNDCDGATDEGLRRPCRTRCGGGIETCTNGSWTQCSAPAPQQEICNGRDDDCDGAIDEGLTRRCESRCGTGSETCAGGQWVNCSAPPPSPEQCDGKDNDCDGTVDEGCVCQSGDTRSCSNVGECKGIQRCLDNGRWSNQCEAQTKPTPEVCDTRDNDCDGLVDEGLVRECKTDCGTGTETCIGGSWQRCSAPQGQPEVCNGRDDNCDGAVDEGLTRPCSNACGSGRELCTRGRWVNCTAPQPSPEVCDGQDNNCNGQVDEGCTCRPGEIRPCGTSAGECQAGRQRCIATPTGQGQWSTVCEGQTTPQPEVCDGKDNDCDGQTDEGIRRGCTNACGPGSQICTNGQWAACQTNTTPGPEQCDGRDNDCDGQIDEGCPCRPGGERRCGLSTGACQPGVQRCVNGRWEEACNGGTGPSDEVCDGLDNDCDGQVDENLLRRCGTPCGNGGETCQRGNWTACTAQQPVPEVCDSKDNDCDGIIDNNATCPSGQACIQGQCLDSEIPTPDGSVPDGSITEATPDASTDQAPQDTQACQVDADCPNGQTCQQNTCVTPPIPPVPRLAGGCGCSSNTPGPTILGLLLLFLLLSSRRRHSSP